MKNRTIAVLYGGRSGEHEVSLRSAESIIAGLRQLEGVQVLPVLITKDGSWLLGGNRAAILPDPQAGGLYMLEGDRKGEIIALDVVFPVLHGTYGEDGTVQGLLELAKIPYVGAGVAGSAVGMDKILMKATLKAEGLPVGDFRWFTTAEWEKSKEKIADEIESALHFPCFVKPANLGSSVGVSKAYDREEFFAAVDEALLYDRRVLAEKFLPGREIELSVLGNDDPKSSLPGEVIPGSDFYDYHAKYIDDTSTLVIPAKLPPELTEKLRELAVRTFVALDCSGLGRIDFFVEESGALWVNEINTLPGFTSISMYPKLWEATGISFDNLLRRLIDLALDRFAQKENLKTTFDA